MSDIHGAALDIRHATTRDCLGGQPWPPAGDRWVIVRRVNGHTLWRTIQLLPSDPPPTDVHLGFGGMQQKQNGACNGY
jgi:hypothetical protein